MGCAKKSCGSTKKTTKKPATKKKQLSPLVNQDRKEKSIEKGVGRIFFLTSALNFVIRVGYKLALSVQVIDFIIRWGKEVKGNEEVDQHFLGIGGFGSFLLWMCGA